MKPKDKQPEETVVWEIARGNCERFWKDGERGVQVSIPSGWVFVESGDAGLTRRLKAAGEFWSVKHLRRGRAEGMGLCVPKENLQRERAKLELERESPEYERKLLSGRRSREKKQALYQGEFFQAVMAFLGFASRWQGMAEKLAELVTKHATPVGCGTVARTQTIPIEQRAEAAVIAWMRHQTTDYDHRWISRKAGARREVRRELATDSRDVLDKYRSGDDVDIAACPLAQALGMEHETPETLAGIGVATPEFRVKQVIAPNISPPAVKRTPPKPNASGRSSGSMNNHLSDFFEE